MRLSAIIGRSTLENFSKIFEKVNWRSTGSRTQAGQDPGPKLLRLSL